MKNIILITFILFCNICFSDTLRLSDGKIFENVYVNESENLYYMTNFQTLNITAFKKDNNSILEYSTDRGDILKKWNELRKKKSEQIKENIENYHNYLEYQKNSRLFEQQRYQRQQDLLNQIQRDSQLVNQFEFNKINFNTQQDKIRRENLERAINNSIYINPNFNVFTNRFNIIKPQSNISSYSYTNYKGKNIISYSKLNSNDHNGQIYVKGYYRKDGTYVNGYWRRK